MSEMNVSKLNKAQLVQLVEELNAKMQALQAELAIYQPSQSGRKLSMEKAQMIRSLFGQGMSKNALSLKFQVSRDSIDAVLTNQIYKVQIPVETKKAEVVVIEKAKPAKQAKTVRKFETVEELNKAKMVRHQTVKAKLAKKVQDPQPEVKEAEVIQITEEVSQTI